MTDTTPQASSAAPTKGGDRIEALDIIRGFAVLGILVMNMIVFHQPFASLMVPTLMGDQSPADMATWFWTVLMVDGAMRALFGMLFGAGVYLFFSRLEDRVGKAKARWLHLSRNFWLVVFGLADSYLLLWYGDVLFVYGVIGLLLWTVRGLKVRTLVIMAGVFALISFGLKLGNQYSTEQLLAEQARIEAVLGSGQDLSEADTQKKEEIEATLAFTRPSPAEVQEEITTISDGYSSAADFIWPLNVILQTLLFAFFTFWDSGLTMLLGMALMKSGGFSGGWSTRTYGIIAAVGFAVALPIRATNMLALEAAGFDLSVQLANDLTYDLSRVSLALGYFGLLTVLARTSWLPLKGALSAVGRMALTNYLVHSVIGLSVFILAAQYGSWSRLDVFLFTLLIWAIQLAYSPWWLARYRYGPAEWLWRSLTYRQFQPLRKA